LPDDSDEHVEGYASESAAQGPRRIGDSDNEYKIALASAKREVDSVVKGYPTKYPSEKAAKKLALLLMRIFEMTDAYIDKIKDQDVKRASLKRFKGAVAAAAAAAADLESADAAAAAALSRPRLSREERVSCFLELHEFKKKLDAQLAE
jgi:hypothetical protein